MRSKGLSPVRAKWETVASQFRPYRALIARGISDPRALPASPPLPWAIAFRPFGASNPPRPHTGSNKRRLCKEVGKLMALSDATCPVRRDVAVPRLRVGLVRY